MDISIKGTLYEKIQKELLFEIAHTNLIKLEFDRIYICKKLKNVRVQEACMINNDGSKSKDNNWVNHLDTIVNRVEEIIEKIVNKVTANVEKYGFKKLGVLATYICQLIQKDMKYK